MHEGGMTLNYYRDYFANFPDVVAEDSEYVHWGNAIGGDEYSVPPGWPGSDDSTDTGDDTADDSTDTDDDTGGDWPDALAGGIGALADALRDHLGR